MHLLKFRVGLRDHRPRFAPPEAQLPEHALALANTDTDPITHLNECGQRLTVPQGSAQPNLPRCLSENFVDLLKLFRAQASGPSRSLSVHQAAQAPLLKSMHPVFNGPRRVTQQSRRFRASHSLCHKEYSMKPMVVARFLGPPDFILQSEYDSRSIGNPQRFHGTMKSYRTTMRNYI